MKKIVCVVVLLTTCLFSHADVTLPKTCMASQPQALLKQTIKESEVNDFSRSLDWGQSAKANRYWTVFSDRCNNTTYQGPGTSTGTYSELTFNEELRIAKIEKGYALVYSEKQKGLDYPHISKSAVSRGWVSMKNLLLWNTCPTNNIGIYNKALIVINLDEYSKNKSNGEDLSKRFNTPEKSKQTKENTKPLVASMNFYFVMKKAENGMVLLASECKMNGLSNQVLFGWVSPNSYVPWNERTCLEPNWKPNVAEEMKGESVPVYATQKKDVVKCRFPLGRQNTVSTTRATKYRMNPQEIRYPLLENVSRDTSFYRVTAFARPDGSAHVSEVPEEAKDNSGSIVETKLEKQRTINLIVVIDGTKSMEAFYKPTQDMIEKAYDYFGKQNGNKVRVGVVIYRDYEDGEYVTEYLPMTTPTDPAIKTFMDNGGKYGIKSAPKDYTLTEALYKGLEVALDTKKMGYSSENSNLMFVIGDCGNALEDSKCISVDEIVKRCVANRVQISSFQVRNNNEQAFLLFRQQMGQIVRENMKTQYAKLGDVKARFIELQDGYEFKTNLPANQNFYIGSTRNASLGKVMEFPKLYSMVTNSYMQFADAIDAQTGKTIKASEIFMTNSEDGTSANIDLKFLTTIFSAEQIANLKKQNSLMAFQGYTEKLSPNMLNYWQPIIYISSDEFHELLEKLRPVQQAALQGNANRKPYVTAMKALIRSMLPDITEAEMNAKDVNEVMALVSGLSATSQSLGGHSLIDIQDEKKVSIAEFDAMISDFGNKYKKLEKIANQNYEFSIVRNQTRWYWIPVDDLP